MADHPERTRVYQNHHLDSTRWGRFEPRPDDIVISTSYEARRGAPSIRACRRQE